MTAPACIECGRVSRLTDGRAIYPHRPDLYAKRFYQCVCGAYCGCHGDTTEPLGYPCGYATRKARSAAHAAFDPLWKSRRMSRRQAYAWLSSALGIEPDKCHIGMMNETDARRVVEAVRAMTDKEN